MAALSDLQKPSPAIAIGSTNLTAATGTTAVTGVGFKPKWIVCYGAHKENPASVAPHSGYYDGSNYDSSCQVVYNDAGTPNFLNSPTGTRFYDVTDENANRAGGTITSFDDDGFTINKNTASFAVSIFWIVGR